MSTFKDQLAADRDIFLNLGEFGETHVVERKTITAVLDEAILVDARKAEELGLAQGDVVLFAKCEDLPEARPTGESLNVDGREYIVAAWREDCGMARVYLCQTVTG